MQVELKAIRSKPAVGLTRAVGTVTIKADDLMESAIITALSKMMMYGDYPELKTALAEAAKREWDKMKEGENFKMIPPRKPKTPK